MIPTITFNHPLYLIRVEFDVNDNIKEVVNFEATRITSLISKDIIPISETRIFDNKRLISVSKREND